MEGSGFARGPGVDREGVDAAAADQRLHAIINEAMPRDPREAVETRADDEDAEVASFLGAGMSGMQVTVIAHLETLGRQGSQRRFQCPRVDAHGSPRGGAAPSRRGVGASVASGTGLRCRLRYRPWPTMNTSMRPVAPKALKLAHADVE